MDKERCGFEKDDGDTCGTGIGLCGECGRCRNHCDYARACRYSEHEVVESRKRGGAASAKKGPLRDADLPPLVDHDAAETWTDAIGRAAATGRIGANAANAALRAVKEWREAHDAGRLSDRLEALTDALAEWRKTGDPEPVLELVDGSES